jgi:hypothetical protein
LGGNIVTSVKGPLAATSLSNMNAKSPHAHIFSHCEKMVVIDISFRQRAVIEVLVKRGN